MSKSELIFLDGRLLVLFCTLAEELHFARAAARLFMTHPPLTQQIKRLEGSLGVSLFAVPSQDREVVRRAIRGARDSKFSDLDDA